MTFSIEQALKFGWEKTREHFGFLIVIMLCVIGATVLLGMVFKDSFLNSILSFLLNGVVGLGLTQISLTIYDRNTANWNEFFKPVNKLLTWVLASIVVTIVVGLGFIALIIPGIILGIMFSLYQYRIVEAGAGPLESIKQSVAITKNNRWRLFLFGLTVILINIGGILLIGIGLLITVPITVLAGAFIYRQLSPAQVQNDVPVPPAPAEKPAF